MPGDKYFYHDILMSEHFAENLPKYVLWNLECLIQHLVGGVYTLAKRLKENEWFHIFSHCLKKVVYLLRFKT